MLLWTFGLLWLARCVAADEMDCSPDCVCCKGGVERCKTRVNFGDHYCLDGCVDGIYGHRCHNSCPQNCSTCEQEYGTKCISCKDKFYGKDSQCSTRCSDGCEGEACNDDGTCSTCKQGRYGSDCAQFCNNKNCHCSNGANCTSCKMGYYDRSTFCKTPCSPGCQDGVCNDDGSCKCRTRSTGNTCSECQSGYYGTYCNVSCSVGCVNETCSKDGTCSCRTNFVTAKCDMCADGRTGVNCDHINTSKEVGSPVAAIVGGVIGVIVVIIGIVVLFRRRSTRMSATIQTKRNSKTTFQSSVTEEQETKTSARARTHYNEGQIKRESTKPNTTSTMPPRNKHASVKHQVPAHMETTSDREIDMEIDAKINGALHNKDDHVYYNGVGSSSKWSKIPIEQLVNYVEGKSQEVFSAEFENLPCGLVKPYLESLKRENTSKNRYKGIYPYDDARVKVTGCDGSDYINASFINGYQKPKKYIATLGPMSQQLGDFSLFWKMIWQQRVEKIVMVTNLIEQGTLKCEQYWPDLGTTMTFGDMKVQSRLDDEYAEFTRRAFTLTMGTEGRTLHHLHFTCWPDKAIPDDVTALIEFRQRVLSTPSTLNGPTIVHCSAGVGRTGTYIALDILTKEGEAEGAIDVAGCVHKMRQNRPNMVQTLEQYHFLHSAVVYSLTFDCQQIKRENFNQYMNDHSTQELNSQFNRLQQTIGKRCKDETDAVERNKQRLTKNRANTDIPGDENRPRLYLDLKPGATDYINATYMHSYRMKKRYLVAQTPLPETVIDFLTLAVQERCSCIVSFEADMDKQRNIGIYFSGPNQDDLKKGSFQVSCSKEEKKSFYTERTLRIQHKVAGKCTDLTIPHLQFTDWDEMKNIPTSTSNFLSFLSLIENVTKQQDDGPILVHCLNGAGKSGLFCVVSLLLHKMAEEHEVSLLNTVRKVKSTRRLAIPSQEQFIYCHGCVSEYLRSFNVYANFNEATGKI
ncbi:receptor-type tyrosine-protein phosphatase alpha-like isoform X2 [Mya arenaria]|uniref:receptor-type tyrosine-protein phosphatase alpha-like isoform X2 n=1 Tax=Mya arenaria TaxID=6604 RepID=UPI0022E5CDA9|nr:receptor-type tyrosine-protein phosphatase alpha-like isoform X2 [Mya arenaria]